VADALLDWQNFPGKESQLSTMNVDVDDPSLSQLEVANRLLVGFVSVNQVNPIVDLIEITATSHLPREAALIADIYAGVPKLNSIKKPKTRCCRRRLFGAANPKIRYASSKC